MSLRDAEPYLARLVRGLGELGETLCGRDDEGEAAFEILALDQRSRDNTLAVLSLLSGRRPELYAYQDVPRDTAIMRASRLAQGRAWLILEGEVDLTLARWAVTEVLTGQNAATVPGTLLAVERELAQSKLGWLQGNLTDAQREIGRALARRGERPLRHPSPPRGALGDALDGIRRWARGPASFARMARARERGGE